ISLRTVSGVAATRHSPGRVSSTTRATDMPPILTAEPPIQEIPGCAIGYRTVSLPRLAQPFAPLPEAAHHAQAILLVAARRFLGHAIHALTDHLPGRRRCAEEDLHHGGIELRARAALDLPHRDLEGPAGPIGAIGEDGVQGIDHGEDPRAETDLLAGQTEGVAAAVPPLLVLQNDLRRALQVVDPAQEPIADGRMLLHLLPLLLGERSRLEEDGVAHADLA